MKGFLCDTYYLFLSPGFLEFFENIQKLVFLSTFKTEWECLQSTLFYTSCICIQKKILNFQKKIPEKFWKNSGENLELSQEILEKKIKDGRESKKCNVYHSWFNVFMLKQYKCWYIKSCMMYIFLVLLPNN